MKYFRSASVAVLMVSLLFAASPAFAAAHEDMTQRWGVGLAVAGAIPTDSDTESTHYVGGNLTYGITDYFALALEFGGMEFDFGDDDEIDLGDLQGMPLFLTGQWRWPFLAGDTKTTAYLLFGLGIIFWDFDESTQLEDADLEVDVDDAFAAKLGGGIDVFLTDNIVANFETSYVFSSTEAEIEADSASITAEGDTDYWLVGGGIKYVI